MALVVNLRIGRVDVLCRLLLLREDAPRKAQHTPADTVDGEHHATLETVVALAVVLEDGETGLLQHVVAVAAATRIFGEVVPLVEAITQAEVLNDLVGQTTTMEIAESYSLTHFILVEQLGEVFLRKLRHMEKAVSLGLTLLLLCRHLLLLDLDMVLLGKPFQRLGVGVMLVLHEEAHSIATLAAAETFI